MKKYTSAAILVAASVLFTFLEISRPDYEEQEFWEFCARVALIAGLLKAFLIREDEEYARQLERVHDKLDSILEDHGRIEAKLDSQNTPYHRIVTAGSTTADPTGRYGDFQE